MFVYLFIHKRNIMYSKNYTYGEGREVSEFINDCTIVHSTQL